MKEPAIVSIRRNADGVVREWREDWDKFSAFDWGENNHSCDCNRGLKFGQAGGAGLCDVEIECGMTAFSVSVRNLNGELLYEDANWARPVPA
jgi:hypothetical protein